MFIAGIFILSACARSLHQKEEIDVFVGQRSFFCSDADYYVSINLDQLRNLIRVMSRHFEIMRSLPLRILKNRTRNLSFYSVEKGYNFLFEGEFPKHSIDQLLSQHPSWRKPREGIDGYEHYSSRWKLGLPESHVMFLTTGDLNKLYQGCQVNWQDFLPSYVISKFEKQSFIVYYPKANIIFESVKKEFNHWPNFSLLIFIAVINKGKYFVTLEFLFDSDDFSRQFQSDLERILFDQNNFFDAENKVFSMLKLKQEEKKLFLSASYDAMEMVELSEIFLKFSRFEFSSIFKLLS